MQAALVEDMVAEVGMDTIQVKKNFMISSSSFKEQNTRNLVIRWSTNQFEMTNELDIDSLQNTKYKTWHNWYLFVCVCYPSLLLPEGFQQSLFSLRMRFPKLNRANLLMILKRVKYVEDKLKLYLRPVLVCVCYYSSFSSSRSLSFPAIEFGIL